MSYNINTQFHDYAKNMISEQKYKDYLNAPLEENKLLFNSNVNNYDNLKNEPKPKSSLVDLIKADKIFPFPNFFHLAGIAGKDLKPWKYIDGIGTSRLITIPT